MNYINQINYFWSLNEEHQFTGTEIALYMYLLHICNKCRWTNPFKHQNMNLRTAIGGDKGVCQKTLERSRNRLKQAGLLDFKTKGKGDSNATYILVDAEEKGIKFPSDVRTDVLSYVPSDVPLKVNSKQEERSAYVRDEVLEKKVLMHWNFNELANFDKVRAINQLCVALHSCNRLNYFSQQFEAYAILSTKTKYKYGFQNFVGKPENRYEDGAWNAENWVAKLAEEQRSNGSGFNGYGSVSN